MDRYMQKNENRQPSYTPYKNKFKMDTALNVGLENIKILEEYIASKISDIVQQYFIYYISSGKGNKRKNKLMGLPQTKTFLHKKGNHQQNKKTTH